MLAPGFVETGHQVSQRSEKSLTWVELDAVQVRVGASDSRPDVAAEQRRSGTHTLRIRPGGW